MLEPTQRLAELERRFSDLATKMADSPEKEAISILHAIMQENRRETLASRTPGSGAAERNFEKVANLYKSAPGMQGIVQNEGVAVGSRAPDFTLPDANGNPVSLTDFRGKNVVLVFYPLDWSPACSDQLSLYQAELAEFEKCGAKLVGVSVDSLYSHGAWAAVRGLTFPLLADFNPKGEVARKFGVMRNTEGFSERALFIIDGQGIIRAKMVSPELHQIPDIYELFEQLKTLS